MFCMNCGRQIPDSAKFCSGCGHPVTTGDSVKVAAQQNVFAAGASATGEVRVVRTVSGERSEVHIPLKTPCSVAIQTAEQILLINGFSQASYNGEGVWTKGTKGLTCAQYIKLLSSANSLGVQAWIVDGIGSVSFKEQSLQGIRLAIWKKRLLKVVASIQSALLGYGQ